MKRLISILLIFTMIFTLTVNAFAVEKNDYDSYPVIIVRGIDFAGLTNVDGTKALSVDAGDILTPLFKALFNKIFLNSDNFLVDAMCGVAYNIFEPMSCDKEGNSKYGVSMVQYDYSMAEYPEFVANLPDDCEYGLIKTAVERYGAENTYYFTYDWRKSPEILAAELDELIETAKAETKKNKVNIFAASMGGMVTTAYFYYQGSEDVNSAVYLSGAQNGTYACGDSLNGNIVFDKNVLLDFINIVADNNIFINIIWKIFDAIGVIDYIVDFSNDFVSDSFDEVNDRVMRDCFGTFLGFWALCPDECFESGVKTIFEGHEAEYPVILEELKGIKDFVMSTEETLANAKNAGVKLSFVSNYNLGLVPVFKNSALNGDGVLETKLTSNFATVANTGKVLSVEEGKYVSPDKVIDASTAWFNDNTWFVKNAAHVAADYNTEYSDFVFELIDSEKQPTIADYPQFMIADENLSLLPMGV